MQKEGVRQYAAVREGAAFVQAGAGCTGRDVLAAYWPEHGEAEEEGVGKVIRNVGRGWHGRGWVCILLFGRCCTLDTL